jgi:hypothetical protein
VKTLHDSVLVYVFPTRQLNLAGSDPNVNFSFSRLSVRVTHIAQHTEIKLLTIYKLTHNVLACRCHGNGRDAYSGGVRFESWLGHRLSRGLS